MGQIAQGCQAVPLGAIQPNLISQSSFLEHTMYIACIVHFQRVKARQHDILKPAHRKSRGLANRRRRSAYPSHPCISLPSRHHRQATQGKESHEHRKRPQHPLQTVRERKPGKPGGRRVLHAHPRDHVERSQARLFGGEFRHGASVLAYRRKHRSEAEGARARRVWIEADPAAVEAHDGRFRQRVHRSQPEEYAAVFPHVPKRLRTA